MKKSRLSVCCGNCEWYRQFDEDFVCTNPNSTEVMANKRKEDYCEIFKEREVVFDGDNTIQS